MDVSTSNYSYDKTKENAKIAANELSEAIVRSGFIEKDLKTTDFDINTNYRRYKDKNNNYHNKFTGYKLS